MKKISIILLFILVELTGCDTTKRRNFVVLIDNSTSVPEAIMLHYITTIQEIILPNMGDQDKLIIQFIDGCSQAQAERIYSFDLASKGFSNVSDGANHQTDSSHARLERYLNVTVKNEIAQTILTKRLERKDCGHYTDIINSLNEAKKLIESKKSYTNTADELLNEAEGNENYEYETCILIFSDMVNENMERTFDFTNFGRLKDEEVNKKVLELKDLNKIPDLAGVKIFVYGATSTKPAGAFAGRQIENVKLFWDLFFQSAGADVKGYGYDTGIELINYLSTNDK